MPRTKKNKKISDQMKSRASGRKKTSNSGSKLLSCGCSMYNLAGSGSVEGFFATGKFYNVIGDSHAGKSLLALTTLAEAANNPIFKDYLLIYDDIEAASEFDLVQMFGPKTAKRIIPPPPLDVKRTKEQMEAISWKEDSEGEESAFIEDVMAQIQDLLDKGIKVVYVMDSLDHLTSLDEIVLEHKNHIAHMKGNKVSGSYGMGIPKKLSKFFRTTKHSVKQTESIIIIVSQTRDDINPMTMATKTRSGGRALKFASTIECWLACIKKNKDSKYKRTVSTETRMKVTKSKLTGKIREAECTLYYDYGMDNTQSMLDFLIRNKFWPKTSQTVNAKDFDVKMTEKKLLRYIEDNDLETELENIVQQKWDEIEESLSVNKDRKRRYK